MRIDLNLNLKGGGEEEWLNYCTDWNEEEMVTKGHLGVVIVQGKGGYPFTRSFRSFPSVYDF